MGYSAATPVRSNKLRDEMIDFLNNNLRHWKDIDTRYEYNPYDGPHVDGSLYYDRGKCRIGFNFRLSHDYVYAILQWVALKIGKKKAFKKRGLQSCLYIVYDGFEAWPVIPQGSQPVSENNLWCVVDSYGCKCKEQSPDDESYEQKMREFNKKYLGYDPWDLIKVEMKKLDDLWEKRNEIQKEEI